MDSDDCPRDILNEDDTAKHEDFKTKKYVFDLISDSPKIVHYLKPKVEEPEFIFEEDVREPNVELDENGSALPDITI